MSILNLAIDSYPSSFVIIDSSGLIVEINQKTTEIFKYCKEELVGKPIESLFLGEQTKLIKSFFDGPVSNKLDEVFTGITKDQKEVYLEIGVSFFEQSNQKCVVVNIIDITEKVNAKNSSDKLKEKMIKRLERTESISKIGHWEWIIEPESITWSNELYNLWGLEIGSTPPSIEDHREAIHPDDHELFYKTLENAISQREPYSFTFRVLDKSGIKFLFAAGEPLFVENNLVGFFGTAQDITERKLVEQNKEVLRKDLEKSNETYSFMAEGAGVGIWDWEDVNGDHQVWSSRFYELLGYDVGEIEASIENFNKLLHPDDIEKTFSQVDKHFKGLAPFDIKYRLKAKDGHYLWFRGTGKASFDVEGKPKRMVGAIQDIHQEVMAQIELKRSNEDLDHYAYITSHDLREPLRGMRNFAGFLIEDYSDVLDDEGKKYLETIRKLGMRLENYLDSLLYYSRLGRDEMAYNENDLNVLLIEIQETYLNLSDNKFKIKVCNKLPVLNCDGLKLSKVFGNLLTNAIRYNQKEEKLIEISYKNLGLGLHQFWIKDNGIGIKEEFWERVFVIFRRLHNKSDFEGRTGLGLTLAKKAVERHGGEIWVESSDEKNGTTFTFTIQEK